MLINPRKIPNNYDLIVYMLGFSDGWNARAYPADGPCPAYIAGYKMGQDAVKTGALPEWVVEP